MANYTLTNNIPTTGKIEVNPEQSEAIQRVLFEMGYEWVFDGFNPIHTDKPFLFWDEEDKYITFGFSHDREYFNSQEEPLIYFNNHFK